MKSRIERYYEDDLTSLERTKKNANLYKEVYGKYTDLENLPVEDNTNEIDLSNLKTMIKSRDDYKKIKEYKSIMNKEVKKEEPVLLTEEQKRVYDINKLLENARIENAKIKKVQDELIKTNYNFLATLEGNKLTKEEIVKSTIELEKMNNLPIVNELNKKEINSKEELNVSTASLPLEILNDLKPTEDTMISAPMVDNKEEPEDNFGKTFYSGSYTFSKKDFMNGEDDFVIQKKSHTGLKLTLLIIGISILMVIIFYLLKFYGFVKL